MALPLRIEFEGALYHVTSRGDRREAICEDDADRAQFIEAQFIEVLGQVATDFNWVVHAWCLMTTTKPRGDTGVRSSIVASPLGETPLGETPGSGLAS